MNTFFQASDNGLSFAETLKFDIDQNSKVFEGREQWKSESFEKFCYRAFRPYQLLITLVNFLFSSNYFIHLKVCSWNLLWELLTLFLSVVLVELHHSGSREFLMKEKFRRQFFVVILILYELYKKKLYTLSWIHIIFFLFKKFWEIHLLK